MFHDPSGSSSALVGTGFLNGDTGLIAVFVVVITIVLILIIVLLFYCFCRDRLRCCNNGKDYDGDDSVYTIDSRPAGRQSQQRPNNRGTYHAKGFETHILNTFIFGISARVQNLLLY